MRSGIAVELSGDEALVLFDWLARFNAKGDVEFADQAEQRVLWDLETLLERGLAEPLGADYSQQLADARGRLRDAH